MSSSMGIASLFVVATLAVSPFAMAEESPAFVARNAAIEAHFKADQAQLAAGQHKAEKATPDTVKAERAGTSSDS